MELVESATGLYWLETVQEGDFTYRYKHNNECVAAHWDDTECTCAREPFDVRMPTRLWTNAVEITDLAIKVQQEHRDLIQKAVNLTVTATLNLLEHGATPATIRKALFRETDATVPAGPQPEPVDTGGHLDRPSGNGG